MQENIEIWKDVAGYEGLYQVSNSGRIKSLGRMINAKNGRKRFIKERIVSQKKHWNGYMEVSFTKNEQRKTLSVHRIVADAFIENELNLPCINHMDEDRHNNNMNNLEWCDHKYNANYGTRNEKLSALMTNNKKLSKPVIGINVNDKKIILEFPSISEAGRVMGCNHSSILDAIKGRSKKSMGYTWSYK